MENDLKGRIGASGLKPSYLQREINRLIHRKPRFEHFYATLVGYRFADDRSQEPQRANWKSFEKILSNKDYNRGFWDAWKVSIIPSPLDRPPQSPGIKQELATATPVKLASSSPSNDTFCASCASKSGSEKRSREDKDKSGSNGDGGKRKKGL